MTERVTSVKANILVWIVLLILTLATYVVAFFNLGVWSTPVALAIAVVKAVLVALFFMNARFSQGMTRMAIVGGLVWLGILIVGTMDDVMTRGMLGVPGK